jgi:hypothetical protein
MVLTGRHAFYVGWVVGTLTREHGVPVRIVTDNDGYTDRIRILLEVDAIELVVPPPPDTWTP